MKNKILLIGLAVVFALSMSFVSCAEEDGGSSGSNENVNDKPGTVKNVKFAKYPGATVVSWDRVYNAMTIEIYRSGPTAAGNAEYLIGNVNGNANFYVDAIGIDDITHDWIPGQSYTYRFVTHNNTYGTIGNTKSGSVTTDETALGAYITQWAQTNTIVEVGTPFRAVHSTTTPIVYDRIPVTIKGLYPDLTYNISVRQIASATGFSGIGAADGTQIGTATLKFDSTQDNLAIDRTVIVTVTGWNTGAFVRQVFVTIPAPSYFQIDTSPQTNSYNLNLKTAVVPTMN